MKIPDTNLQLDIFKSTVPSPTISSDVINIVDSIAYCPSYPQPVDAVLESLELPIFTTGILDWRLDSKLN